MKNKLKIKLKTTDSNVLSYSNGVLTLKKAGSFRVVLEEFEKKHPQSIPSKGEKLSEYNDIVWIWSTVHSNLNFATVDNNITISEGLPEVEFHFPEFLEGGGLVYIEAYKKGTQPANSPSVGLLVQAVGKPEILAVQWRYYSEDGNGGKILPGTKLPLGSSLQLHVFTKSLYGQEIAIQLMDDDSIAFNESSTDDDLPPFERPIEIKQGEYPPMPSDDGKKVFVREVKTYQQQNETIPSNAEKGTLITEKNGKDVSTTFIQKCIVDVYIDPFWIAFHFGGETEMEIYAKIRHEKTEKYKEFKNDYIKTSGHEMVSQLSPVGNKPVLVGEIETNIADFYHCRYNTIKLSEINKAPITVFDSKNPELRKNNPIIIDVIAGEKSKYYIDIDFQTEECEAKPHKHKNNELKIIAYPKDTYKFNYSTEKVIENKEEKENQYIKTEVNESSKTKVLGGASSEVPISIQKNEGTIIFKEKQIEFDVFYNYDINTSMGGLNAFWGILKYFWLPNLGNKIKLIKLTASSCAFSKNLDIAIYPDIKWSFVLGFNVEEDQLKSLVPAWDNKVVLKGFNTQAKKNSKKAFGKGITQNKANEINKDFRDVYKNIFNTKTPRTKKDKPNENKLSTVLEIIKNVDVSLKAQLYEKNEWELTDDFFKNAFNTKLWKDIYEAIKKAAELLDGKEDTPKDRAGGDSKIADIIKKLENNTRFKNYAESLKRPPQEVEILYPQIAIGGGWQYESIDTQSHPELVGRVGLGYDITFEAKPILGAEIRWHIIDLLCRKHPIAYAVLAAVKGISAAIGDNPDAIKVDFWVRGQMSTALNFKGNFLTKDKEISVKGDTHVTAGIDLALTIQGKVVSGKYTAVASAGVAGGAEVGFGIINTMGCDSKGIYTKPAFEFDGIKLYFELKADARIIQNNKKADGSLEEKEFFSMEETIKGEITMLAKTFETDKLYIYG